MNHSFESGIDLDEDSNHSTHDCHHDNDNDNQKLFHFFESYLNKSDKTDGLVDEEPDLSLNNHFAEFMAKRVSKTPQKQRSSGRRVSCFADIENQKSTLRQSSPIRRDDHSLDESVDEDVTLPWDLNAMNENQVIDLINTLVDDINRKEAECPQLAANYMANNFDKQMALLNDTIGNIENTFETQLKQINIKSDEQRLAFNELIGKELGEINSKSKLLSKLMTELNVIQQITQK